MTLRTWAEYMEDALYHPERGFFSHDPVGREFVTAPHVSPVFAACVAQLLAHVEHHLGSPVTLLEPACADGTLASQVAASAPALAARCVYMGLDRDPAASQRAADATATGWASPGQISSSVEELPSLKGLIFANELFDNVAFHRLVGTEDGTREIFVEEDDGQRHIALREPSKLALDAASRLPSLGEEVPSSPQGRDLFAQLLSKLEAGWMVIIDYSSSNGTEPVRGYRGHLRVDPLHEPPGSCDITGPVDMDALQQEAERAGASVRRLSQARLLRSLGSEAFIKQLSDRQLEAQERGEVTRAMVIQQTRDSVRTLTDPEGMGSFEVLIARMGDLPDLPFPEGTT